MLLHLIIEVDVTEDSRRPQPHQQRIPDWDRVLSGDHPISEMLHTGLGDRIGAGTAPALLLAGMKFYQAGVGHLPQFAIDLLMRGVPEVAERQVEPAGQLFPTGGTLDERRQDRAPQRHYR